MKTPLSRRLVALLGAAATLAMATLIDASSSSQVEQLGLLAVPRTGHAATALADGRVLITGGRDSAGTMVATAEVFDPANQTSTAIGVLNTARINHTATLLADGRVLIAGGTSVSGALTSAEIFDPANPGAGFRVLSARMGAARAGHTATRLHDGTVLIAGGDDAGTAEIFKPTTESFSSTLLAMAAPRNGHTATLFSEDSVLLAGGDNDSMEYFSSVDQTFTLDPQKMTAARTGHEAIGLSDTRLLFFGGDTGHTIDEFNPSADTLSLKATMDGVASSATLLANDKVLVLRPDAAGLYSPDAADQTTAFTAFDETSVPNSTALKRTGQTATELSGDKKILVAGGENAQHQPILQIATFNPARIWTDKDDYQPSDNVILSGAGWKPNENVYLYAVDDTTEAWTYGSTVTADSAGAFVVNPYFVVQLVQLGANFSVSAVGAQSAMQADVKFTDSGSFGYNSNPSPASFTNPAGNAASFTEIVTGPKNNGAFSANVAFAGTGGTPMPSGWVAFSPGAQPFATGSNPNGTDADENWSVTITVPPNTADGTYTGKITANVVGSPAPNISAGGGTTVTVIIDHTPPAAPSTPDLSPGDDTGVSNTDNITNKTTNLTFGGNGGEANSPVKLFDGSTLLGTTTANGGGNWSTAVNLITEGDHSITAKAMDASGNISDASGALLVTVDTTRPTVTINQAQTQADPTNSAPINFTAIFSENVVGFTAADVTVSGTAGGTKTVTVASTGPTTYNVAISGMTTAGTVIATIPAGGVTDIAGNTNVASTSTDNNVTFNTQGATSLAVQPASGAYGGAVTLSATLTSAGSGVNGKTITFTLNGNSVGTANTNSSGVASLSNVSLSGINAGSYPTGVGASFAGDTSFSASNGTASLTVGKANATWTTNANSKTYGDPDPVPLTTGSGSGFTDPVTATYSRVAGESVAGSPYHITATLSAAAGVLNNYNITNTGADFTINKKNATWNTDPNSKTYGDSDPVPLTTGSGSGFSDPVTATYSRVAGESVAGSPYHITATLSAAAGVLNNYNITNTGADFTINKKNATWNTDPNSKTYGDSDPVPLTTGSGSGFTDPVTATYGRVAGESVAGSPYHITATLSAATGVLDNYNITNAGANFTINKRLATWNTDPNSKTYGDADPVPLTTGSGSNFVDPVTATYSRVAGESVAGSPYHITATLSAAAGVLDNYNVTNAGADFTINKRNATWNTDPNSKTYGDADPVPLTTGSGSNFVDTVTASYTRAAGESVAGGPYHITATLSAAAGVLDNYNVTNAGADFTINKRNATWNTDPNSKTYGDADPVPLTTGSGSNFVDTVTASYTRAAGESVVGGPYHITATLSAAAGVLDNYNVTNAGANFTINKRLATWTTNPSSKTYGDADPVPLTTGSGSNFVDTVTASYTRVAGESVVGGPYHITATLSAAAGVLDNYNITNAGANFTINTRPATWTTNPGSKTYGNMDPSPLTTGSGSNFVAVDNVMATYTRVAGETVLGGPYHITANLGPVAVLSNYSITNSGADFTINPRPATVKADNKSKTYGDDNPMLTATVSGTVNSDVLDYSLSTTAVKFSNVDNYAITVTLGSNPNYSITPTNGTLTINKAIQTITWANPANIVVGTPLSSTQLNATVAGVAGGSAPGALTYTPPAGTVLGVGATQLKVDAAATINYNAATTTVYINVNYTFVGFLQPIDNLPIVNSVKAGQTIPVKWQLKDADGNLINDLGSLASSGLQSVKIACSDGTPQDVIEELSSPGSTVFRFDGTQFIFNWQTTKSWAGTCRLMTVTLKDGKVYSAQFTFK